METINPHRIYSGREKLLEHQFVMLKESNLSSRNKKLITQFQNHLSGKAGQNRVAKVSSQLRYIAEWLGRDLSEATKTDIEALVARINHNDQHSEATKTDYRRAIKQFYKWYETEDVRLDDEAKAVVKQTVKMYKHVKELKSTCKIKDIAYSNIITDEICEDVLKNGCVNFKHKSFFGGLHETGARAFEYLNLKIKDVEIHQNRAMLTVNGKTGQRRIPIVKSLPYFVQYLSIHPFKDNRDAYLWTGENRAHMHEPLKHAGAQKLINKCFERAGLIKREVAQVKLESGKIRTKTISIKKKVRCNLHWFRHSRATLLAPHLTESLLCKYMGWALGSQQVRRYVHLCTEQLESAVLEMHGVEEKDKKEKRKPPICACGTTNTAEARYCYACGNPLNVQIAIQDQERVRSETDNRLKLYAEIMGDSEKRQKFEEFKQLFLNREGAA